MTARFCRKCGESLDAEEETRVAVRGGSFAAHTGGSSDPEAPEDEIFAISPTLLFVKALYVAAAIGALFLAAITSMFLSQFVSVWFSVLIGLLLFLIPGFYHFKQKIVSYTLTESSLEIDEGFISRSTQNIPIRRIQDVTVSSGFVQRLLGFGDLMIDNASDADGKIILKNIDRPKHHAELLLRQMRRIDK